MLVPCLRLCWIALAASPLLLLLGRGFAVATLAAGALYLVGTGLLALALARDPKAETLASFGRTGTARLGAGWLIVVLTLVGADLPGSVVQIAFLGLAAFFFLLWVRARSGEALARKVSRSLLAGTSVGAILAGGEFFFRLPSVVARTGGNTPGLARFHRERYDRLWEKNLIRLRSFHVDSPKPEGVFRIATLGDSFTFGERMARTEDIWPYVLERRLAGRARPVDVVNLAWRGYTTVNEAEALERLGWLFEPDVLVLQYFLNDPLPSGPGLKCEGEGWLYRTVPLLPGLHGILDESSYLYSFLNRRFDGIQRRLFFSGGFAPLFADEFEGWKASAAAIRTMAEETRKRNVPMLVVLFPYFAPGGMDEASYPFLDVHRKIASAVSAAGLPFLDMLGVFAKKGRDGRSWWVFPNDPHPTVEGHQVIGEAVAAELERLGLVPAAPR